MKKSDIGLLVVIGLFFVFSPLISSAQFIPLGEPCTPDTLGPETGKPVQPNGLVVATCPFDPKKGASTVHIRWDLKTSYANPICYLYNDDSKKNISVGVPSPAKPKDDAYIGEEELYPGATFRVYCYELCPKDSTEKQCPREVEGMLLKKGSLIRSFAAVIIGEDPTGPGCLAGQCVCVDGVRMKCGKPMEPGIGCTEPKNCAEYPSNKSTSASSTTWLANVWSVWQGLFK